MKHVSTEHGFRAALPYPAEDREGTALCLSGGGYRAALFHLGALRRLNELGVLSKVDTFTSVSGGSIVLAWLASHLADGGSLETFEEGIAEPMRAFARTDIRSAAVVGSWKPWNWFRFNAAADALVSKYETGPARGKLLKDLPERPRFVFCSTDLRFRTQWAFDSGKRVLGSDWAGWSEFDGEWTLARAVAASSCFPPVFRMRVANDPKRFSGGLYEGPHRDELVREVVLTDGGIYDNLGIEPVWRDHRCVLVSDAAPSLTWVPRVGAAWSALRQIVTLLEQATDVRKRWLISAFLRGELKGAYWGIRSLPSSYPRPPDRTAYSDGLVSDRISQVRIDLDEFSEGEIAVLENHGYLIADVAVRCHAPHLVRPGAPEPSPPWPDWLEEERADEALRDSDRTKIWPGLRLALLRF